MHGSPFKHMHLTDHPVPTVYKMTDRLPSTTVYKMLTLLLNTTPYIPFQLSEVKPCSPAAINSGSKNEITITWDEAAGECDYTVTDASKKEVECKFPQSRTAEAEHGKLCFLPCCTAGKAVGKVNISPMDIGRYLVTLTCAKGSEAMYFDAIFSKRTFTL